MAWRELILYLTQHDADIIRDWVNADDLVAWVIREAQDGRTYRWKAMRQRASLGEGCHTIWHIDSQKLTVPSGKPDVDDAVISDPFAGWTQVLGRSNATSPWFGANFPGPFSFSFKEAGSSSPKALGRSGFNWAGDHFSDIGYPAPLSAKRWWSKLTRFVKAQSTALPWPVRHSTSRTRAYAFKGAMAEIEAGRPVDDNP